MIYGVGVSEAGKFGRSSRKNLEYALWLSMLNRCYNEDRSDRNKTYEGCAVSEEFLNYQYFAEWCSQQIGFGLEGYHLDKDILKADVNMYHPSICVFVPKQLNTLFNPHTKGRGSCVQGVTKDRDKFRARVNSNGVNIYLGKYATEKYAELAYIKGKNKVVSDWVEAIESGEYVIDPRVVSALKKYQHKSQLKQGE